MKLGNLYNLKSFEAFCDSANNTRNFHDSYAGVVLARQLTHVDPRILEKKYPELAFMAAGIEGNNTGGYSKRIQSLRLLEQGGFNTAGDNASNKGKISLGAEDNFLRVITREAESTWTEDEVKEADLQNINLPSQYVSAHNKIYMREVDSIGLIGIETNEGLLNYSGFTSTAAGGAIGALTAQQMYDEYADLINAQWAAVNNTPEYKANRVITPVYAINTLQSTILNTAAGDASVLRALQNNFPGVEFFGTFRADNVGGSSATVAFSNNNEAMVMRIPVPLTIGEVIKIGSFDHKVDSKYRIAGLDILEDTSGYVLTGL